MQKLSLISIHFRNIIGQDLILLQSSCLFQQKLLNIKNKHEQKVNLTGINTKNIFDQCEKNVCE